MATGSSNLAWEIPWIEQTGGLQSVVSQKSWSQMSMHMHIYSQLVLVIVLTLRAFNKIREFKKISISASFSTITTPPRVKTKQKNLLKH